jgi:hypothetical protein
MTTERELFECPLCGGDMRNLLSLFREIETCSEHEGAPVCWSCMTCTSTEPTPELVAVCKERRHVHDTMLVPLLERGGLLFQRRDDGKWLLLRRAGGK